MDGVTQQLVANSEELAAVSETVNSNIVTLRDNILDLSNLVTGSGSPKAKKTKGRQAKMLS